MKNYRFVARARVLVGSALAVGMLLFPSPSSGQIDGPLPPIKQPPNIVPLTPVEQLGKDIVFDNTLSNPEGYACCTCHAPRRATRRGSDRRSIRSSASRRGSSPAGAQSQGHDLRHAAFSPEGPYYDADAGVYIGGNFWDGRAPDDRTRRRSPSSIPTRWTTSRRTGSRIRSPVGIPRSSSRRSSPGPIRRCSSRSTARTSSPSTRRSRSSRSGARRSRRSKRRARSASSARSTTPPSTAVPAQNLYTLSASEERGRILYGVGPNPTNDPNFGMPNASSATRPRPSPASGRDGREGHVHDVLLRQHRRPQESEQSLLRDDRSHQPIRPGTTRSGRSTSTTASAPTPPGRSTGPSSSTRPRATSSSSGGSS